MYVRNTIPQYLIVFWILLSCTCCCNKLHGNVWHYAVSFGVVIFLTKKPPFNFLTFISSWGRGGGEGKKKTLSLQIWSALWRRETVVHYYRGRQCVTVRSLLACSDPRNPYKFRSTVWLFMFCLTTSSCALCCEMQGFKID